MSKSKVWVSWSSGKDSAYAYHKISQNDQYDVVGLLATVTKEYDRVSMHGTRRALLESQAQQLGLPLQLVLIPAQCTNEIYEAQMQAALEEAVKQGITHIVFGDLFLEDVRRYREDKLKPSGIEPLFPLWGQDTRLLAHEMIDVGMKAILTCVDPKKLHFSFAGREFDTALLNDLPNEVDPCAERGEFHTFVYDAPFFSNPISVSLGQIVTREQFVFADVQLL